MESVSSTILDVHRKSMFSKDRTYIDYRLRENHRSRSITTGIDRRYVLKDHRTNDLKQNESPYQGQSNTSRQVRQECNEKDLGKNKCPLMNRQK